jgi:hypothetical protein
MTITPTMPVTVQFKLLGGELVGCATVLSQMLKGECSLRCREVNAFSGVEQ